MSPEFPPITNFFPKNYISASFSHVLKDKPDISKIPPKYKKKRVLSVNSAGT